MLRRLAALRVALFATLLIPLAASADAPKNANNCAGAFASGLTPGLTAEDPPSFGEERSAAGRAGTVDDTERGFTEALASCGSP